MGIAAGGGESRSKRDVASPRGRVYLDRELVEEEELPGLAGLDAARADLPRCEEPATVGAPVFRVQGLHQPVGAERDALNAYSRARCWR